MIPTLKSNPSSTMPSGTSFPGRATQGGLVWHPAVLGLQNRLNGLWWKYRRCLFRQPAASSRSVNAPVENLRQTGHFSGSDLGPFSQSNPKVSSSMRNTCSGESRFNPTRVKTERSTSKFNNDYRLISLVDRVFTNGLGGPAVQSLVESYERL